MKLNVGARAVVAGGGLIHHGRVAGFQVDELGCEWVCFRPMFASPQWRPVEAVGLVCGTCQDCRSLNDGPSCVQWLRVGDVRNVLMLGV